MTVRVAPSDFGQKSVDSSKKDLSKWNVSKEALVASRGDHKSWKGSNFVELNNLLCCFRNVATRENGASCTCFVESYPTSFNCICVCLYTWSPI
jgi:hypothetical protein